MKWKILLRVVMSGTLVACACVGVVWSRAALLKHVARCDGVTDDPGFWHCELDGAVDGCVRALCESGYGKILGVPVGVLGIAGFAACLLVAVIALVQAIQSRAVSAAPHVLFSGAMATGSAGFLILMLVKKLSCTYCKHVHAVVFVQLAFSLVVFVLARRDRKVPRVAAIDRRSSGAGVAAALVAGVVATFWYLSVVRPIASCGTLAAQLWASENSKNFYYRPVLPTADQLRIVAHDHQGFGHGAGALDHGLIIVFFDPFCPVCSEYLKQLGGIESPRGRIEFRPVFQKGGVSRFKKFAALFFSRRTEEAREDLVRELHIQLEGHYEDNTFEPDWDSLAKRVGADPTEIQTVQPYPRYKEFDHNQGVPWVYLVDGQMATEDSPEPVRILRSTPGGFATLPELARCLDIGQLHKPGFSHGAPRGQPR